MVQSANANITNCSNCGGVGDKVGTITPNDPFFYPATFLMKCARKQGSFNSSTYTIRYKGYMNSKYIWGWNFREHKMLGYTKKNKVLE